MAAPAAPTDVYYKKRIDYASRAGRFSFDVAHTLFSTFEVDDGTDLFLRTIEPGEPRAILDIGCGAGVIGIVLARSFPEARVVAVDRDLLAVRYARHNAQLNETPNVEVLGSVGIESVPRIEYDLVVSNIPAKIGDDAIEREFILDPLAVLRPGGEYWFVVVSGLNHLIPRLGVKYDLKMKQVKKRSGHAVYQIRKAQA